MPTVPDRRTTRVHRAMLALTALLAALVLSLGGLVLAAPSASAASAGAGFGSWAPLSASGWHGSVMVGDVHTYCIVPGLPAPTGESVDHGVRGDAGGLSARQLGGINHLVSLYGQTGDPVQAAAVGWAVKAVANLDVALHSWGYPGDSLAGAVHWIFDRLAPEHAGRVAQLAEIYYAEALAVPVPATDARLTLTTDPADPRRGTVRLDGGAGTSAVIMLTAAVFADTGVSELPNAPFGVDLPIVASPPDQSGTPFAVSASARLTAAFAPAVRHITTAGQQDTAGPGGGVDYTVVAADAAPRPTVFSPGISTQVAAAEVASGPFIDDVTIKPVTGVWPRADDGSFVPVFATATVYRTDALPVLSTDPPADAVAVGDLALTTDPGIGGGTYRVASEWELPGPGVYTAVWRIEAGAQPPEVARHLERDYVWAEDFGVLTQITTVPTPPSPAPGVLPAAEPQTLAATGSWTPVPRVAAGGLAAALLGGALIAHLAQRRRRDASR